jgi:hypothetical protein
MKKLRQVFEMLSLVGLLLLGRPMLAQTLPSCPKSADARAALDCFLKLDLQGLRLDGATATQVTQLTTWTEFPGWDGVVITLAYKIAEARCASPSKDLACYEVIGTEQGTVSADFKKNSLKEQPGQFKDLYQLRRGGPSGWQVVAPDNYAPQVSPAAMRAYVEQLNEKGAIKTYKNNALQLIEALRALETK